MVRPRALRLLAAAALLCALVFTATAKTSKKEITHKARGHRRPFCLSLSPVLSGRSRGAQRASFRLAPPHRAALTPPRCCRCSLTSRLVARRRAAS